SRRIVALRILDTFAPDSLFRGFLPLFLPLCEAAHAYRGRGIHARVEYFQSGANGPCRVRRAGADRRGRVARGVARGPSRDGRLPPSLEIGRVETVPVLKAWATPAGPVPREAFEGIRGRLCALLAEARAEGLLLALHGAMVAEGYDDADGEVVTRLRKVV